MQRQGYFGQFCSLLCRWYSDNECGGAVGDGASKWMIESPRNAMLGSQSLTIIVSEYDGHHGSDTGGGGARAAHQGQSTG